MVDTILDFLQDFVLVAVRAKNICHGARNESNFNNPDGVRSGDGANGRLRQWFRGKLEKLFSGIFVRIVGGRNRQGINSA